METLASQTEQDAWRVEALRDLRGGLERLWPLNEKDRGDRVFAMQYGFRLRFYSKNVRHFDKWPRQMGK
jgi:hypothetical protein